MTATVVRSHGELASAARSHSRPLSPGNKVYNADKKKRELHRSHTPFIIMMSHYHLLIWYVFYMTSILSFTLFFDDALREL